MSGIPVLATKVGGIPEQIVEGETGWLADDEEDSIEARIESLILHKGILRMASRGLRTYKYDGDAIVAEHETLLKPHMI